MNRPVNIVSHQDSHKHSRRALNKALVETLETRWLLTSVSGYVFNDVNLNEAYNLGVDTPLEGCIVYEDDNNNGRPDSSENKGITDVDGYYTIVDIPSDGTTDTGEALNSTVHNFRLVCPSGYRVYSPDPGVYQFQPFLTLGKQTGSSSGVTAVDYVNVDFAVTDTQKIFGAVYNDANASGIWDPKETGMAGWQVYADSNNNGDPDMGEISTTTSANGNFVLDGIPAGDVVIRMVLQTGYRTTNMETPVFDFVAHAGKCDAWVEFGVSNVNTISGRVFLDFDNSGSWTDGDVALVGWTVYNDANNNGIQNAAEPSVVTDDEGNYIFPDLANGTFHIRPQVPTGWIVALPVSSVRDYTPPTGVVVEGADFSMLSVADSVTFTGIIYNDEDGDGTQNAGEENLAGWIVYSDTNHNGKLDLDESSAISDEAGNYELADLIPGNMNIRVVLPEGWHCSQPTDGLIQYIPSAAGDVGVTDSDFGVTQAHTGSISGIVYIDANTNGIKDASELGYSGATILLDVSGGGEYKVVSGVNGLWSFTGLGAGDYVASIDFSTLTGTYNSSTRTNCLANKTLDQDNSAVSVAPFGITDHFVALASVVYDSNRNQRTDSSEPFLSGWTIFADFNDNGILDSGEPSGVTDSEGYAYLVFPSTTLTSEVFLSYDNPASFTSYSSIYISSIMVTPSEVNVDHRFYITPGSTTILDGYAYNDANQNGHMDSGEDPIPDLRLFADLNGDGVFQENEPYGYTDNTGEFVFGTRIVTDALTYYVAYLDLGGIYAGVWSLHADYDPTQWRPVGSSDVKSFAIAFMDVVSGVNFNFVPASGAQGHVYIDADADAYKDNTENPMAGAVVYVDANNNGVLDQGELSATTDSDGYWLINSIPAGHAVIRQLQPAGTRVTTGNSAINLTVAAGTVSTVSSIGDTYKGKISGTVFYDKNRNGAKESSEPKLANSRVFLDLNFNGRRDSGEPTTLTNSNGIYLFNHVQPGEYRVMQVWSTDYRPQTALPFSDVLVSMGEAARIDPAGNFPLPKVKGAVFVDANGNGQKDKKEKTFSAGKVYIDANNNGKLDSGETYATLDSDGSYELTLPGSGKYTLRLTSTNRNYKVSVPATKKRSVKAAAGQTLTGVNFVVSKVAK